jgi:aminoglycoside phosphotransferase family enzyme
MLEKMMEPGFYPHPCQAIEAIQTLTSWLLFAGDFVYKIKKPVHFRFVDARTPARRYRLCRDEVQINQRHAPEVYVGVAGIVDRSGNFELVPKATFNGAGVCEFALVMNRLPSERMLSRMVANETITVTGIHQLAERLVTFHRGCSVSQAKMWGSAAALSRLIATTITEAGEFIADTVMRDRLARAGHYLRSFVINHPALFDKRARNGCVREAHGELTADSIFMMRDRPAIIGCLSNGDVWRYCDVSSELASVIIDFEMARRNDLSDALMQAYMAASNDYEIPDLISFYKCYRAARRGHLEILTSLQAEIERERRMLARHYAGEWFQMAERIASAS